jgi:hypothetical protein
MSTQWKTISPTEATKHPLYGVKGWLLFFAITNLFGLLRELGSLSGEARRAGMTISQFLSYPHPSIALLTDAMKIEAIALAIIYWLLFTKNAVFRPVVTAILICHFPLIIIFGLFNPFDGMAEALAPGFFSWVVSCAVWVTYLQRSRRVRVTFEHCVRDEEVLDLAKAAYASHPYVEPATVTVAATGFEDRPTTDEPLSATSKLLQQSLSGQPPPSTISAGIQMDEDTIYATVAEELESGKTDKGLWTRLFAECNGDEKQTKVLYIKRRVEKLMAAEKTRREQFALEEAARQRQEALNAKQAEQLRRRNAGLVDPDLIDAVSDGNWSAACQLLEQGASPFGTTDDGIPLCELAIKRGDQQMVDLIKTHQFKTLGAGVSDAVKKWQSGIDLSIDDVTLLVNSASKYADLVRMQSEKTGYTLLHWCARLGMDGSATTLLRLGASAGAKNNDGKQPQEICRSTPLAMYLKGAAKGKST